MLHDVPVSLSTEPPWCCWDHSADALQIKVDSMSAKVDFLFNKDIGNHCIWEIVDNKVVIKGVRNLKQEMKDASRLAFNLHNAGNDTDTRSKVLEAAGPS